MFNTRLKQTVARLELEVWILKNPQKYKLLEKVKVNFREGNSAIMTVVGCNIEGDTHYDFERQYKLIDSNLDTYYVYEYSIDPCGTN